MFILLPLPPSLFIHLLCPSFCHCRLCTSCVLHLHPSSFCPSCFEFFDYPFSATSSAASNCFPSRVKCSFLTHLHCFPSLTLPLPPSSALLAPLPLPLPLASALLCASLNRYLSTVRDKADRSVRESAVARKKAKDLSLDHLTT
ncbi:hypothetical protein PIB30_065564, partial [Stylosanthes scabra]|nr:hypothetical protein [Stylosanthes scabra]